MKKKLFSILQFIALLAIGITLMWLVFRHEDPKKIWSDITSADYRWVGFSLFISLIAYTVRAIRWKMLIVPLGYNPKLSNTFYAMMVGYLANLALPRLGEITKCGALNRAEKIPIDKLIGTVIVERVVDVISLLCCLIISAFLECDRITSFLSIYLFKPMNEKFGGLLHSTTVLAVGVTGIVLIIVLLLVFRKKIMQSKFIKKIRGLASGLIEGLRSVRKMKNSGLYIFLTAFMWTLYMLTSYVCFFSLPSTNHLGISAGIFILVAGGFGMSAPVQGGIGAFHFIVKEALTMYNVPETDGLVYATVVHGSQTIFAILLGFLSLILLYFSRRKTNNAIT